MNDLFKFFLFIINVFTFIFNIFVIFIEYPFPFGLRCFSIAWVLTGLFVLIWFLKRMLPIKKVPKDLFSLKKVYGIFVKSSYWLKFLLVAWCIVGIFLSIYFFIELKKPRFVTDRIDNEICFTIVNPPLSSTIKIVDIKLEMFSYNEFVTLGPTIEYRPTLYVNISGDKISPNNEEATGNLHSQKYISIFPSSQTVVLENSSSVSFRIKFRGDEYLSETKFLIIVEYIVICGGKKTQVDSDKLYVVSKGFGAGKMGHINIVDKEKFFREIKEMQKILVKSKEK